MNYRVRDSELVC